MDNLVIGIQVYNEADKFLIPFLEKAKQLTDKIVVVDDGSTDDTNKICKNYTDNILVTNRLFIKNEGELRETLWNECTKIASKNDYIMNIDTDELLPQSSIDGFEEEIKKCNFLGGDSINMTKYDMWNENEYREDSLWNMHKRNFVRCIKYKPYINYKFIKTKMHTPPLPCNSYFSIYPSFLQVKHMGYSTPELRQHKYEMYTKVWDPGPRYYGNPQQYKSILDPNPQLKPFVEFKNQDDLFASLQN